MMNYSDSLDYTLLPDYAKLNEDQRQHLKTVYSNAYQSSLNMGIKIAQGRAYETVRVAITEVLKEKPRTQAVPPSIFASLPWA